MISVGHGLLQFAPDDRRRIGQQRMTCLIEFEVAVIEFILTLCREFYCQFCVCVRHVFTTKRLAAMKTGMQKEAKELAVNLCSVPSSLRVVTIVTPEGNRDNAERKAAGSSP